MVSFQVGASFAKQLIPVVGAPGTTALRLGLSALLVLALQRPWRSMPTREAWPMLLAYGLSLGAMNFVFYLALRTIPLGIAVAIEFVGPLGVAVAASHRRIDYLWVDRTDREGYPNVAKFGDHPDWFSPVFTGGDVVIYKVTRDDSARTFHGPARRSGPTAERLA